jgi:leucyl aminopeptidase
MRLFVVTASPVRQKTDCAIVGLHEGGGLVGAGALLDAALKGRLTRLVKAGDVRGKAGELRMVDTDSLACARVLVVGLGKKDKFGRKQYRKALVAALGAIAKTGARDAVSYLAEAVDPADDYYDARLAAEAVGAALYRVPAIRSSRKPPEPALKAFGFAVRESGQKSQAQRGLAHGQAIAAGSALTRDLANLPANVCTPTYLAQQARELARSYPGVKAQVLEEADLKRLKMGSFLSVTNGTEQPAKLIVLRYDGGRAGAAPVALVGKGVTFDSGGLSLKPTDGMMDMKCDMAGAAATIGIMITCARLQIPLEVHGIFGATENMIGPASYRPGDVFPSLDGKTVEIINTDAEGRLVLADVLTHAVKELDPDYLIDHATLTGACMVALGPWTAGLFSNDDELARRYQEAASAEGEGFWRMPLDEELRELLKSDIADIKHVGDQYGGSITAALFLREFVGKARWMHLDIAGPAFLERAHASMPKGATGFGISTAIRFLETLARDSR